MKNRMHEGTEWFTHGQEVFIEVSGLTALTICVVTVVAMMLGVQAKRLPWFLGAVFVAVLPAAFMIHWAIGWLTILVALLGMSVVVASLRDARKKALQNQEEPGV